MIKDILHNAIQNFSANSKFNLEFGSFHDSVQDDDYSGHLKLKSNAGGFDFIFEVKKGLSLSKLPDIDKYVAHHDNIILVSDYISKSLKAYLKEKNVSYLDTAGNAFITNNKGVFIYVETNKNARLSSGKSNRAFSKSGLKVIYQILINKDIVNKPYRYIGQASKVSIDTVAKVFKELLRDKYLIQIKEKEFEVQDKERLLQEWVTIFNRVLRPKLKQRNFKPKKGALNQLLNTNLPNIIGGELAAESLSNYLIAEGAVIYTDKPFIDTALSLELIPATGGIITLIEKFWAEEFALENGVTVHPILVYADLLSHPKPRNLETAKIIYDKYVKAIL